MSELGAFLESLLPYVVVAFGALASAWIGYWRGKREKALDRRIAWHETAIERLARYEEQLERLRNCAVVTVVNQKASTASAGASPLSPEENEPKLPRSFMPPDDLWSDVSSAERSARASLRLADLYVPEHRLRVECSVAMSKSVNLVGTSLFIDLEGSPGIPWQDLPARELQVARIRREVQESLKVLLELDGLLASLLGRRYRMWRMRRSIDALRAAFEREAPAHKG